METVKVPSKKGGRRRAVHFVLRDEDCPGLIEFLDSLENRMESKTVRAILFTWFEQQKEEGTVDLVSAAIREIHTHQLAVLQRSVDPDLLRSTNGLSSTEKKRSKQQSPSEQLISPILTTPTPSQNETSSPAPIVTSSTTQPNRSGGQQGNNESLALAADNPGVRFLDSMLGIADG